MAVLPALIPDADGTATGMTVVGAASYFDAVNDWLAGGTADEDTSYITSGLDASGDVFLRLSDVPTDLASMDSLTAIARVRLNGTRVDDTTQLYAQVFDGNSTATPLTSEILVTDHTTGATYTDDSTGLVIQGTPTKTQWNNAYLRLRWVFTKNMASDGIALRVTAARLDGTYTAAGGTDATPTPGTVSTVVATPAASAKAGTISVPDLTSVIASAPAPTALTSSPAATPGVLAAVVSMPTATVVVPTLVGLSQTVGMGAP